MELDEDEETLPGVTAVDVAAEAEAPEPDRAEGKVPTPEWVASVNLENREVPPLSHRDSCLQFGATSAEVWLIQTKLQWQFLNTGRCLWWHCYGV